MVRNKEKVKLTEQAWQNVKAPSATFTSRVSFSPDVNEGQTNHVRRETLVSSFKIGSVLSTIFVQD